MRAQDLNLRHLAALAAVRSAGSISAAARTVHLTQPAITQSIAKLERQLDTPLFIRQPEGMEPTPGCMVIADRIEGALRFVGSRRATMAQIRAFLGFASHGTYASAAKYTGLSEASLHRAVGDLQIALGARLLSRRGRSLILTRRGQETARNLRLAILEIEAGLVELAALAGREIGTIRIGAMPLARARLLPEAISAFHAEHPGTDISVVEGSYAELVVLLLEGRIDLMVGALRATESPDLQVEPLFSDIPLIVGRKGHPLETSDGMIDAARLGAYPWITPAIGTPLRTLWTEMFENLGVQPPHVAIECGSAMMIRQMLLGSNHLALLSSDQVALELEAGWLAAFGAAPGGPGRMIGVTYRRDWRPTSTQALLLDLIRAVSASLSTKINSPATLFIGRASSTANRPLR